jgi:threonine dehydrogenase-like Zn-dependent dehydrogenase
MKAATLVEPGRIEIQEAPIPTPTANEVRVKLEGCGVCASNLSPYEGQPWFSYPFAPGQMGHEGWGTVDAVGSDVTQFQRGQRVAMLSNHAYAQYDVAPVDSVVPLPEELEDQAFPGEPLGCAVNIWKRVESFGGVKPGDTVAIVGIGFLGALLVRMASQAGARVFAIARRLFALDVAKQMGAHELIVMDDHWRIIEQVKGLTQEKMCDVVIECVGKQWPLDLSSALCRERGRLVIAGYHQDGPRQVNMQEWNWRGLDVINAHEREQQVYIDGIAQAAREVSSGRLNPSSLYTHTFPLEQLGEALDATRDRPEGFMKALIRF